MFIQLKVYKTRYGIIGDYVFPLNQYVFTILVNFGENIGFWFQIIYY